MKKLKLILSGLILLATSTLQGQDTHFSQYNATPMSINPALTGIYDGIFRFTNTYRSQWGGLGKGYSTVYSSIDFPMGKSKSKNHYWGAGLMLNTDKAGEIGYYTTQVQASVSFTTALNEYATHFIALGTQVGLSQRGMDLEKMTWDSQWNGNTFDPSLNPSEKIQLDAFTYPNFNMGLMWYYLPDEYNHAYAGLSFYNLNTPNTSFYVDQSDQLSVRYTIHAGADFAVDKIENTTWISPKLLYMSQGGQEKLTLGGFVKHRLILKSKYTNFRQEVLFSWGACYRWADAVVVSARVDYGKFGLGISYDFNVSSLGSNAGGAGGPEISLAFLLPVKRGTQGAVAVRMPKFF